MEKRKFPVLLFLLLLGIGMDAVAKDSESDLFLKAVAEKEAGERQAKMAEATKDITISYEYKSRTFSYGLVYEEKEQDLTKKAVSATVFSMMAGMIQNNSKNYAVMVLLETDLKNAGFLENMMASKASFKVEVKSQIGYSLQEKIGAKEIKQFADMTRESREDYYLTLNCNQVNESMLPLDVGSVISMRSITYKEKRVEINMLLNEELFEMASTVPDYFKILFANKLTQQMASHMEYFTGSYVCELQNGVVSNGGLALSTNPQLVRLEITAAELKAMGEHPLDDTDREMYSKAGGLKMLIARSDKKGEKMELIDADYHDKTLFLVRQSKDEHIEQMIIRVGNNREEFDLYKKGYILESEKLFKEDAGKGVNTHVTIKSGNGRQMELNCGSEEILALFALPQYERDSIIYGYNFLYDNVKMSSKSKEELEGFVFYPQSIAFEGNNIVMTFIAKGQKEFKYYSMGLITKGYELLRKMDKLRSACTKLRKNFVYRVVSKDGKQKRQEVISWVDIR